MNHIFLVLSILLLVRLVHRSEILTALENVIRVFTQRYIFFQFQTR